jgi:tetratricopeptide (TPR) repeat protein
MFRVHGGLTMRLLLMISLVAMSVAGHAATATAAPDMQERQTQVEKAHAALLETKPEEAIRIVDPVIAAFDAEKTDNTKDYFCAEGPVQTLLLAGQGAANKRDTIIMDGALCHAIFIKGFALIDLNRSAEAGAFLERAAAMAPLEAHYANEYAEWHKSRRNWQKSFELFEKARSLSTYAPEKHKVEIEARSLRGMAFTKIELGDLDQAEKYIRESLKLTPKNIGAVRELEYIEMLRKK